MLAATVAAAFPGSPKATAHLFSMLHVMLQGVKAFSSHTDWITGVQWHPTSEHHLVSCSHDNTAKVWDTRASIPLLTLEGHTDKVGHDASQRL